MLSAKRLFMVSVAASSAMATAETTQAGQWLDSILGRNQPVYPVGTPVPVNTQTAFSPGAGYVPPSYAPYAGSQLAGGYANAQYPSSPVLVAPNPVASYATNQTLGFGSYNVNQPPTYNAPLLAPGFPQTVAGTLPTAAYDTQWGRVPVTYYRPVTAFDPRYGTTVTSLQPCTSYQYQAQRPPVIAPRPILGEYGAQANKWPGITGPGYNPTGLAVASGYAPTYQTIPNSGFAMVPMNPMAPVVSSGSSTGMPATVFPTNTFASPYASNMAAASMPAQQQYSGVVPSAAWMPANSNGYCANGACLQPSNIGLDAYAPGASGATGNVANPGMAAPYIPGATVTPVGPPMYSSTPAASGNSFGGSNPALSNPALTNPAISNPNFGTPASGAPVMPNQQIFPSQPKTGFGDPEATQVPVPGGSSASLKPSSQGLTTEVQRLPMVAIDQDRGNSATPPLKNELSQFRSAPVVSNGMSTPSQMMNAATIPSTLPDQPFSGMKPLSAPVDYDSKPKWNPSLLDPDDRTVWERKNRKNSSIIQLVSGTDSQGVGVVNAVSISGAVRQETDKSGFRPVTTLK